MALVEFLRHKKSSIVTRWQDRILDTYAPDTAAFLKRKKDPFANPVGRTLVTGTEAIFDLLLAGSGPEPLCGQLEEIIKIRAIQDFTPAQAVSFVFFLKDAVREEMEGIADAEGRRDLQAEWIRFESGIDQLALFAFDIFTRCRERVYELRVNEVKRSVSKLIERANRNGFGTGPEPQEAEVGEHPNNE